MLKSITVFCGSASTCPAEYTEMAEHVGRTIARQGRSLIYGSGSRGLMGQTARAALEEGGHVVGVNTRRFEKSVYTLDVSEYVMTETMQDRKVTMMERGDACVILPGGIGTLDEATEIFSLAQLGIIDKPFGVLNMNHFYDGFLMQVERMHQDNFLKEKDYKRLIVAEDIETLLRLLDEDAQQRGVQA